jgi:Phosphate-selective porin O and P
MRAKGLTRGFLTAGALLLSLAMAASSWAQTMFYQELEKNGRIYVFALMKEFESFDKSGEMGKAITRLGYGPKGETVVFDSEDAINYYNFKHDKPGEVFQKPKEAPKPKEEAFFKVGVTIFADYTYQDAPKITDTDKNTVSLSNFEARRAYINVTGNISDWVSYRVTPDVAARLVTSGTGASTNVDGSALYRLKYAFGQVNFDKVTTHGTWVRIGQQQTPFVDFMEGIYRYRFQGTIFEEREGFLSSSDVGVSGRFVFPNDYGDIHAGYYNGDTYSKAEINDQKAFQIRGTLRPFPKVDVLKGIRLTAFYDHDSPIKNGERNRFIAMGTFEHKYLNLGANYIDAKDQSSPTKAEVKATGWTIWATPRTLAGFEALVRYDHLKPNKSVDAVKSRILAGVSYWLKVKAPLATSILVDYEKVDYDTLLNKPTEKRFEIKTLFNF